MFSFRSTFFTQSKADRQMVLSEDYSFRCDCIACSNNFPLFHGLKSFDKKIYKFARKGKDELSKLDSTNAKKRFQEYCETIQKHHDKAFPSSEIVVLQECILHCISTIIKPKFLFPWIWKYLNKKLTFFKLSSFKTCSNFVFYRTNKWNPILILSRNEMLRCLTFVCNRSSE